MTAALIPPTLPPGSRQAADDFHRRTSLLAPGPLALPNSLGPLLRDGPIWPLPALRLARGMSLEQAITERRTRRDFDASAGLRLAQLARLLVFSLGRTSATQPGEWAPASGHRAVPSAGASYTVDAWVIAQHISGLPPGIYAYDSLAHALVQRRIGQLGPTLTAWTMDQPWMLGAAAVFVLVGDMGRVAPRYASRGYRYMLFEAGHIAQNLCLLGTAHGLCVQATGGFADAAFDSLLGLQTDAASLYLVALGPGLPG